MIGVGALAALAANRKQFFDLIEIAEREFNREIDEVALAAEIDSNYPNRDSLTEQEARDLLMKVSRPKTMPAAGASAAASR